ncbi:MAG: hypothetical protein HN742_17480 [Lentisphaerae bacterium]|jgi:hypothetical protein|nr:hypothetical protein [Lentisphaerota bacterium]MBT4815998.1 hypothetical protein [Lentisphaerota bacterium]MBT5613178.1 hypothetical protein [Lentisphaerota bacterium]MBT7061847.1 hypothetical protein [Lentisphaerota bacterium]MBT7843673.1 hypothetical protein [Lentisphaerota bacterium]
MCESPLHRPCVRILVRSLLCCLVVDVAAAFGATSLPVGYDRPASDKGGPVLAGGLRWVEAVFPHTITFAETPSWPSPTVMFITNYGGVDTVHELARRFPMDVLHFWGNDAKDRDRFLHLLNSRARIDCFVMSRFKTKSMPPELQYEILKRVSEGAGFVMVDDFDRSPTLTPKFLELKPLEKGKRVFDGIPYDGLRQWKSADVLDLPIMNYWNTKSLPRSAVVEPFDSYGTTISPFGKGRMVWISTGTHWSRAGRVGRTLLPHISQRRDMWVETDYYYSHTAKAIMRAVRIPQMGQITEVIPGGEPAVLLSGKTSFSGKIRWQVRDTWGVVSEQGVQACSVAPGAQRVPLSALSLTDAGRRFVDVWLLREDGAVVDWGSGFTIVERGVKPCVLEGAKPEGVPRGTPLSGVAAVPAVPVGTRLVLSLWDRHWREVGRVRQPVASGEAVPFSFESAGLDGQIWNIHADLVDPGDRTLSRSFLTITSPHTRASRGGFHPVMTCVSATNPEEAARAEYLRRLGFLANRPYTGGNPMIAESLAWCDLQFHPFSYRVTGASDSHTDDRITDWEDPSVREQLVEMHQTMTRMYRPFGLRGYNLSDDSSPSPQLPLGPYTTIAFHRWLEKEYGGLWETAAAWGMKTSGFGRMHSWGRIHQKSVKAWYDKGITGPWIDAQRFLEEHWVDTMGLVQEAVRSVHPEAHVGSDASYYRNTMADLFGRLDYIAPYYRDVAVKVAVSRGASRRAGDYGACLGSYGDKPERMTGRRSQIWDVLFAGGTGFYYWSFSVGLAEDITLSDAHALYQCEVAEEVMDGIGELFTQAERVFDPVAILYSRTSGICDQLEAKGEPLTSKANSFGAFQHAMEDAGLNPHTITDGELIGGWLATHGTRMLLLPGCNSLSAAEIAAVQAYVDGGGVVIADTRPATRFPNGSLRKAGALDALFGVKHNRKESRLRAKGVLIGTALGAGADLNFGLTLCDPRLAADGAVAFGQLQPAEGATESAPPASAIFAEEAGKGYAILLNASFSSYDTIRGSGGADWEAWHAVIATAAKRAGLEPSFRGTSRGKETPGLEFSPFRNGDGWLLGVEDLGCGDDTGDRRPFEVALPGRYHLYDIRASKYMGEADTLKEDIPRGGHRAYALLPYRVAGLAAGLDRDSVAPGGLARLKVRIQTDGEAPAGHVLRITARPPGQEEDFFPFKRVVRVPRDGTLVMPLRVAHNDPSGMWQITVTDVSTGASATVLLPVREVAE